MILVMKLALALGIGVFGLVIFLYSQTRSWTAGLVFYLVLAGALLVFFGMLIAWLEARRS